MKLIINESTLLETLDDIKRYYPNIPEDIFMELIALDPTYTGKDSAGKYGKWLLNLYNKGKLSKTDFNEVTPLLNQFKIYRNRIQNKDLNSYKSLDDLASTLASVVDDDSMLTNRQKVRFLKNVKSGKISLDKSDDYDVVLDTPNFIVYIPNTHEASMKLGKGTEWCTAHENPDWYNSYTENGRKLYIIKNKRTGERWQYSDKNGDFLNQDDMNFDIPELMCQDKKLSKFFEKFLGVDFYNFDGTFIYTGGRVPSDLVERVENVVISDSVTNIDKLAFYDCSNLKSIVIPNSVTSIGGGAFERCSSLTNITIPNSVTSIDKRAFGECSSLTIIIIPNSVTSIGTGAFYRCSSLTSITIPNSITSIGSNAFDNCTSLKSITIPNSVTDIGNCAFYECSNLTSITITNNVTHIGYSAFFNCSSLKSITISNSITAIDDWTFLGCSSLTSITIPNSVTSIGDYVFRDCPNLTIYTNNDYVIDYCEENEITVKPLSTKNESYTKSNKLKLQIRE